MLAHVWRASLFPCLDGDPPHCSPDCASGECVGVAAVFWEAEQRVWLPGQGSRGYTAPPELQLSSSTPHLEAKALRDADGR